MNEWDLGAKEAKVMLAEAALQRKNMPHLTPNTVHTQQRDG